ncbi:PDC sensor domain-containing protein [Helicobacter kayseriensis]|uniref:PDC sensor domain-containing protein n=1 Tax=Helicobacter kayseriensis TaxID=2905877 RepID=UPI001E608312|nr:PDC sensor domain-containing protein [Helicobacter kayseriensis]MCE3047454.1 PDC sensor domain-containing protein [Helicobacter kayseriensis]MCE3048813.1 PDC sensor domain-containing protein [Helicobacter kayseriensis]
MLSKDIIKYSNIRYEVRAYMCYLFSRYIKNPLISPSVERITQGLEKIALEIQIFDAIYILDAQGNQVRKLKQESCDLSKDQIPNYSDRAYFYECKKEGRCILTDPYPSKNGGKLVVTASYPIYDQNNQLQYIACIDLELKEALAIGAPTKLYDFFSRTSNIAYTGLSAMLFLVSILLFVRGVYSFWHAVVHFNRLDIKEVFEATILLTLSLAIVDLVKAIFEEEVLGRDKGQSHYAIHKTMIRFLGSIIIALAIEALMLVFKFSIIEPEMIRYTLYLTGGVALLLLGLSVYVKFAYSAVKDDRIANSD